MNIPRLDILKWPDQISRVLDHLERTTHQDFHETPMDDGSIKRRPVTSPIPVLTGTVSMTAAEKRLLQSFFDAARGHHFSFEDPKSKALAYATFVKPPFDRSTHILVGSRTTYDVDIVLKDTTELIRNALQHLP